MKALILSKVELAPLALDKEKLDQLFSSFDMDSPPMVVIDSFAELDHCKKTATEMISENIRSRKFSKYSDNEKHLIPMESSSSKDFIKWIENGGFPREQLLNITNSRQLGKSMLRAELLEMIIQPEQECTDVENKKQKPNYKKTKLEKLKEKKPKPIPSDKLMKMFGKNKPEILPFGFTIK
jgi:hypothetical protein